MSDEIQYLAKRSAGLTSAPSFIVLQIAFSEFVLMLGAHVFQPFHQALWPCSDTSAVPFAA